MSTQREERISLAAAGMGGPDNPQATEADVEEYAAALSKRALECRVNNCWKEGWYYVPVRLEGRRGIVWDVYYRCRNRCGCWWMETMDPQTGDVLIKYPKKYPKGKLFLAKGIGRIVGRKKAILKKELFVNRQSIPMLSEGDESPSAS